MLRTALTLIVLGAALLTGSSLAATGPGSISAGAGCSVQCIETALVTPTASSASVEVSTSVAASVTVTASKLGAAAGQYAASGAGTHVSVPPFVKHRTVVLTSLEPETTYRIVVTAIDLQGMKSARVGTFATRKVKVAVDTGTNTFDSGLGCSLDCIQQAIFTQSRLEPNTARLELRTATPANLEYVVEHGGKLVGQGATADRRTAWTPTVSGLVPGTTYEVTVRATDAQGHTNERTGTFRTVDAIARITITKITVIDDSEKGSNRGEIRFDYQVNGRYLDGGGYRKLGSGSTIGAPVKGTSRPGALFSVAATEGTILDLRVQGFECDKARTSKCVQETSGPEGASGGHNGKKDQWAWAVGAFTLEQALASNGALPIWHGTNVTPPPGHDGYVMFQTTAYRLKLRVYATVDLDHEFPS